MDPDLNFPVAYMNGDIVIENGTILEFLDLAFKNLGNNEIFRTSYLLKKFPVYLTKISPKKNRK